MGSDAWLANVVERDGMSFRCYVCTQTRDMHAASNPPQTIAQISVKRTGSLRHSNSWIALDSYESRSVAFVLEIIPCLFILLVSNDELSSFLYLIYECFV